MCEGQWGQREDVLLFMISLIAGLFLGLRSQGAGVARALLTLPLDGGLSEE